MHEKLTQKAVGPVAVAAVGLATAFAVLGTYGSRAITARATS